MLTNVPENISYGCVLNKKPDEVRASTLRSPTPHLKPPAGAGAGSAGFQEWSFYFYSDSILTTLPEYIGAGI